MRAALIAVLMCAAIGAGAAPAREQPSPFHPLRSIAFFKGGKILLNNKAVSCAELKAKAPEMFRGTGKDGKGPPMVSDNCQLRETRTAARPN